MDVMRRGSWVALVVMVAITSLLTLASFVPELGVLVGIASWFGGLLAAVAVVRSASRLIRRRHSAREPLQPVIDAANAVQDIYLGRTYSGPVTHRTPDTSTSDVATRSDWLSDGDRRIVADSELD